VRSPEEPSQPQPKQLHSPLKTCAALAPAKIPSTSQLSPFFQPDLEFSGFPTLMDHQ
jgi:hypothetical protein